MVRVNEETREEMVKAYKRDWTLIPLLPNSKKPAIRWEEFATRKPTKAEYKSFNFDNYAIVCGEVSGITVVDIDLPDAKRTLEALNFSMTDYLTPKVRTPGGYHLYFKHHPGIRTGVGVIGKGVDVRSDGGYVVGPGSVVDGSVYNWVVSPEEQELEEVPEWLLPGSRLLRRMGNTPTLDNNIQEGGRNMAMIGLAGSLVGRKVPPNIVLETMLYINDRMLESPLPRAEVAEVHASAERRWRDEMEEV